MSAGGNSTAPGETGRAIEHLAGIAGNSQQPKPRGLWEEVLITALQGSAVHMDNQMDPDRLASNAMAIADAVVAARKARNQSRGQLRGAGLQAQQQVMRQGGGS